MVNFEKEIFNMGLAKQVSTGSKDPSTKVGAYIVDEKNRPVSLGYNGFVKGSNDKYMTYEKPQKYYKIIHAEMNAILFSNRDLEGCTLYCTHAPCENCLKHIMQKEIKKVVYDSVEPYTRMSEQVLLSIVDLALSKDDFQIISMDGTSVVHEIEEIVDGKEKKMD